MLTTYFTRERTRVTYAAGPAGPYLDDFSHWLEQRGFTTRTIRRCLFGATQFTAWAEAAGIAVQNLDATSLEAFCGYLAQIPPDLVVRYQAVDIVKVISLLIW